MSVFPKGAEQDVVGEVDDVPTSHVVDPEAQAFPQLGVGARTGEPADGFRRCVEDANVVATFEVCVTAPGRFDAPVPVAVAVGQGVGDVEAHAVHRAGDVAADAVALRQGVRCVAIRLGVGVALVATLGLVLVVLVPRQAPRIEAEVARGANGHEAAAFADPGGDLAFQVVVHVVPPSWQDHHVVAVPVEPLHAADGRHRVTPNLLKRVPDLPKTQRRHLVAHHHGHAGRCNVRHVVGAQVRTRLHHAALEAPDVHARHPRGELGQARAHAGPQRFVVPTRHDQGPARVGCAVRDDGPLGHAHRGAVVQQASQHRGAEVGAVIHHVRIGRPVASQIRRLCAWRTIGRQRHCGRQGVGLESVGVWQGPGGDVVGEAVAELGIGVHEHLKQSRLRLPRVDDQVARRHAHFFDPHVVVVQAAGVGRSTGLAVSDAVGVEQLGEPRQLRRVVARRDHVAAVVAPRLFEVAAVKGRELFEHAVGVHAGRFDGGEPTFGVVLDAVGKRQGVAHCRFHRATCAAAAPLFVGHPHSSLEHGPRVAIRRVEQVKDLAREVQGTALVEVLGVVGADVPLALALPRRDDLVVGLCRRGKVVRVVDALLVEVHVNLWHPLAVEGRARFRFPLGLPGQIPIHVKQIVVGPTSRPGLVVFPRRRIGVGTWSRGSVLEVHVPIPSIRVHARVHHHHGPVQQVRVRCRHRLHCRHGGLRAHRLVAVDVVAQVHPNHAVAAVDTFVHASGVVGPKLVEVGHVGFRRHDQTEEGTAFRGLAVFRELPVGDRRRHVLHVVHHGMVPCEFVSERVSENKGRIGLAPRAQDGKQETAGDTNGSQQGQERGFHQPNIGWKSLIARRV